MINRAKPLTAKVCTFCVGHKTYWGQFEGLKEQLLEYHSVFTRKLDNNSVEVTDFGMVDSSELAYEIAEKINAQNPDIIFCNMTTYATSSVFAPIMRSATVPVVLVALQPLDKLDCSKANTRMQLENDNICSVPEFMGVAIRLGKQIEDIISGTLYNDAKADGQIAQWCSIAHVLHSLKTARIAAMGHVMEAMYDMHADFTTLTNAFGLHVPLLEIDDAVERFERVSEEEIKAFEEIIKAEFDMPEPKSDPITRKLTDTDLRQAAIGAAALHKLVEDYNLTGMAYYYEGKPDSIQQKVISSFVVGNSILNAKGVPMCGEYDVKTCIAMLIMDRLNIGGSFAELHPFDFTANAILVGHDGPHHIAVANGKPALRSLLKFHGKPGCGASVEFKLKEGPITLLGIGLNGQGKIKFITAEGESQEGEIPPTGNTNTRGVFGDDTHEFIKRWCMAGPTHHFALGIGHHSDTIAKLAKVLGIECEIVK